MGWMVSIDRIERVQQCLDYVQRRYDELSLQFPDADIRIMSESRSNPGLRVGRDDWWGTVDITIGVIQDGVGKFLEIIDYKDGQGWVGAKDNTQLIAYAGGKLDPKAEQILVRMTIVQPKTNPSIRYEDTTSMDVMYAIERLASAAMLTDEPDAPLISGDHCTWCKHGRAKNCTTKSEESLERMKPMFNSEDAQPTGSLFEIVQETFGDITVMESSKLEELADAREGIMAVFDRVNEELQRRVEDPDDNTVTGYAMLPGRGSQEWAETEETIVKMLKARRLKKDDIFPAKLISPAAVMKLDSLTKDQKEKIQKVYIEKKPGGKKLTKVRASEPVDAAVMFADIPGANSEPPKMILDVPQDNPPKEPVSFM
jgi:hypothetical protein